MEPSNLSINPGQSSASQFFQNSIATLKGWGSRVVQQLEHQRALLPAYSSQTKVGLLFAVNAIFFAVIQHFVNKMERRNTEAEKARLYSIFAIVVYGAFIGGLNVGLSKLLRYQLSSLALYAITIANVAVYLILKKPVVFSPNPGGQNPALPGSVSGVNPTPPPAQLLDLPNTADFVLLNTEVQKEIEEIELQEETINQGLEQLERDEQEIQRTLSDPNAQSDQALQLSASQNLQRITGEKQALQARQISLAQLKTTLGQEEAVISEVAVDAPKSPNPSVPTTPQHKKIAELQTNMRSRFNRTVTQQNLSFPSSPLRLGTPTRVTQSADFLKPSAGLQTPGTPVGAPILPQTPGTPVGAPILPQTPGTSEDTSDPSRGSFLTHTPSADGNNVTRLGEDLASSSAVDPEVNSLPALQTKQTFVSWLITSGAGASVVKAGFEIGAKALLGR